MSIIFVIEIEPAGTGATAGIRHRRPRAWAAVQDAVEKGSRR